MRTLSSTDLTALAVGLMAERDGETSILSVLATVSRLATFLEGQGLAVPSGARAEVLSVLVELRGSAACLTPKGRERFDHLTQAVA
jgi:acid phosphatase family membrane protein YuiD